MNKVEFYCTIISDKMILWHSKDVAQHIQFGLCLYLEMADSGHIELLFTYILYFFLSITLFSLSRSKLTFHH